MTHLIRMICVVLMITWSLFLDSAIGKEAIVAQKTFTTAEEAAKALGAAYNSGVNTAVADILGDKELRLVSSGDPVIDRHEREWFLSLFGEEHEVVFESADRAVLQIGKAETPYPVPLVKTGRGWRFDPSEGHEDLISRRIGKTELSALNMIAAYVNAQREYFREDHDGDGTLEYAQRFRSSPGQHNGLSWESNRGEASSPIAEIVDAIREEGYKTTEDGKMTAYRGYFFGILKAQGANACGGARAYVVDGKMTGGFALVAFPIRYGISGVLTFVVNQEGVVYQKDLGPKTVKLGRDMVFFNPDKSWTKGQQP
jgi:hypothetical protein